MQPGSSSQERPQAPPAPGAVPPTRETGTPAPAPTPPATPVLRALEGFAAEFREVLAEVDQRLQGATGDMRRQLETFRALPARIAEGMATIGRAVGEAAAAQSHVEERLEVLEATIGKRLEILETTLRDRLEASKEAEQRLSGAMDGVRADLDAMRERVEEWGTPRTPTRVSKDLRAVEERVDDIEVAVRDDLVDAVSDRMEQTFEMRFEALIQLIESRMRQLTVTIQPEDGRRAGLFRRSAV